ncbi:glycosyl hydrolase family 5 [Flavobacterium branchiophilum NBRC 15030 = ATCC 35035]|uniref:Mannan endo-1,4-beta-mannosidase n=1 Tax=Flavobacterium branchiophilum TaxID=55197 RepID=A0A543G5M4_9FLAO|nr:cellulase family glycosylhydrolase [Flavobacterium branchiophilum]OXA74836.1 glycosyl hydrolase family 5 [Flavobacterium branchiophilum NBRC 15030 = ATCC 35035]TQM41383.1 mannan endo-1,4-beta-mannosidase [Flavobacterium branchiophilum]GEM54989.1 hypothetical protein FB1_12100 [Flavobacterium branchiophilum NBRC 15030 = ATCC 35035]
MKKRFFKIQWAVIWLFFVAACSKPDLETHPKGYSISGNWIQKDGATKQFIGANAFHSFGAGSADMNAWKLDIVREFIGNVSEIPVTGNPILDQNGAYLHSLQKIVDSNRQNNKVTVLCAFGWNGQPATLFSGKRPTQTAFWNAFKSQLQAWATHFKEQNDVWIEVWNEPYRYDRADGYTDAIWFEDMSELVQIIRNTGNANIIVVPCAEQGQDASVLINKGTAFLAQHSNILFDIHAYEKWLLESNSLITNRLNSLQHLQIPIIFGEIAPMNAGILMETAPFLNQIHARGISICAWVWKYDASDTDALLFEDGTPNNNNNNNWGSTFKEIAQRNRVF